MNYFIQNYENIEKTNNFLNRNKEFSTRKNMKLKVNDLLKQEKIDKQNDEISFTCHGKPNKREFALNQIRSPEKFMADNLNFLERKEEIIRELRNEIVQQTNKTFLIFYHLEH